MSILFRIPSRSRLLLAAVFYLIFQAPLAGFAAPVTTLESVIDELRQPGDFDIGDVKAAFAFVFNSLPERVKVYPTENYYYFRFTHRGVVYMGNIRLEYGTRDEGKIHFAYEPEHVMWRAPENFSYAMLQASDGVSVEKTSALEYKVTHSGKSVVFALNDLSGVKPPAEIVGPDERYIGPVFDESGIRFFLLFNSKLRVFHYVLDETVPVLDVFTPSRVSDRITIGRRTSFALFQDSKLQRKILVGVYSLNVRLNTYYDGPFDQLPDNFIEGETLRDAILDVAPHLRGRIDRLGRAINGYTRFAIAPYISYAEEDDLAVFQGCAMSKKVPSARYHACFAVEDEDGSGRMPRTIAEGGRVGPPARRGSR